MASLKQFFTFMVGGDGIYWYSLVYVYKSIINAKISDINIFQ